jgi:hypothetical protein
MKNEAIMARFSSFTSNDLKDTLRVTCTPVDGEYPLEDVLVTIEKLDNQRDYMSGFTFVAATFGVPSRGKVLLTSNLNPLGTVSASAMLDPQKLVGATVKRNPDRPGVIAAVHVTKLSGLILAIREGWQ